MLDILHAHEAIYSNIKALLQVTFEMRDITAAEYEENKFDVIYSRDTILHIGDKEALFSNFFVSHIAIICYTEKIVFFMAE